MSYSIRIYLATFSFLCLGSIAIADDSPDRSYPPFPSNLESVEPNRIANAIELSAHITGATSRLPTMDVVWVRMSLNNQGVSTSIKVVHSTVKDLWLKDVAKRVADLAIEYAEQQIQSARGSWYYQPVVFTLIHNETEIEMKRNQPRRRRSRSKPAIRITVEPAPIHLEVATIIGDLKKKSKGSTVTLLAEIDREGKVIDAIVSHSSGKTSLKKAALKTASMNRFTPLFINGEPEGALVSYRIDLMLVNDSLQAKVIYEPSEDGSPNYFPKIPEDEFVPVEVMPEMITEIIPDYPKSVRRSNKSGRVWLKVLVGRDGRVRDAKVSKSSGHTELDYAALRVARRNFFRPGLQAGKSVALWVTYKVDFVLR